MHSPRCMLKYPGKSVNIEENRQQAHLFLTYANIQENLQISRKTCKYEGKTTKSRLFPKRMLKHQGKLANIDENQLKVDFSLISALCMLRYQGTPANIDENH